MARSTSTARPSPRTRSSRSPGATAPTLLLAALQPRMLALAGGVADGTITWCTGPVTLEQQVVPLLPRRPRRRAAPTRVVVVALPTIVTDDEAHGRAAAGEQLAGYGDLPVYRAVLDAEGAEGPADVSVVGDEAAVTAHLERLARGRSHRLRRHPHRHRRRSPADPRPPRHAGRLTTDSIGPVCSTIRVGTLIGWRRIRIASSS